jgi:hypothetical protein
MFFSSLLPHILLLFDGSPFGYAILQTYWEPKRFRVSEENHDAGSFAPVGLDCQTPVRSREKANLMQE